MKLSDKIQRLKPSVEKQLKTVLVAVREAVRVNLPIGPTGDLRNSVKTTSVITTATSVKFTVYIDETIGDVKEYAAGLMAAPMRHTGNAGKDFTESFYDHGSAGTRAQRYQQGYQKLIRLGTGFLKFEVLNVGESVKTKRKEVLNAVRRVFGQVDVK